MKTYFTLLSITCSTSSLSLLSMGFQVFISAIEYESDPFSVLFVTSGVVVSACCGLFGPTFVETFLTFLKSEKKLFIKLWAAVYWVQIFSNCYNPLAILSQNITNKQKVRYIETSLSNRIGICFFYEIYLLFITDVGRPNAVYD